MAIYSGELIGEHHSVGELRRLIKRVAASPTRTVLIYGETGTGKGLVARMLHEMSARAKHQFVDVNCAAIPGDLLESELFGHERGAFTGAVTAKVGLVEEANGGTIFLDEIRDMEMTMQAKLLSLLDTQRFRRVGAVRHIEVDARIVAATNKILLAEVGKGRFRQDLYYRLQVVAINIPPLRERGDDVLVLTEYFLRKYNARYGRTIQGYEPAIADFFRAYSWPGNVRELENLLERIFILEDDNRLLVRHLPDRIVREVRAGPKSAGGGPLPDAGGHSYHDATLAYQRQLIEAALTAAGGSMTAAARALRLSRHALRHQMQKVGLAMPEPPGGETDA
jgi:transcriptional regulator with PAS, ATPase and Fis domain